MLSLIVAAALSVSAVGAAESVAGIGKVDGPMVNEYNEKLICKAIPQMGTRLGGKRVCHTKNEWDQQKANADRALSQVSQRALTDPSGGRQ